MLISWLLSSMGLFLLALVGWQATICVLLAGSLLLRIMLLKVMVVFGSSACGVLLLQLLPMALQVSRNSTVRAGRVASGRFQR